MFHRKLLLAAIAASTLGLAPLPAAAEVSVYLGVAPPPPRYEVVPGPRAGYVWQPGFWEWRDHRHYWRRGHWVRERPGYVWYPSRWERRGERWVLERGRWHREHHARWDGRRGGRDRDGDGVPDRYDAWPDKPYRY